MCIKAGIYSGSDREKLIFLDYQNPDDKALRFSRVFFGIFSLGVRQWWVF